MKNRIKEEAITLNADPHICEELKGLLRGIWFYHFVYNKTEYRKTCRNKGDTLDRILSIPMVRYDDKIKWRSSGVR